jgi:aminoglycoside phosphotransferase
MHSPLEQLNTLDGYRQHFMDADLWCPYVLEVCRRHEFSSADIKCGKLRAGLAGTYPTFIVDDRWVVKFFGRLYEGELAFETEQQAHRLLAGDCTIPAPALIASGLLFGNDADWNWPYLIFEYIPGVSIGEVYGQVSLDDKSILARNLGRITRQLHQLSLVGAPLFQPSWEAFISLLQEQRAHCAASHREWNTLPQHLIEQIEAFLLPIDQLVNRQASPHLIHADITGDHLLGRLEEGHWVTLGLIDFGDAMIGNIFYELVALHLDLFRCDKRLLKVYLEVYGLDEHSRQEFPTKALNMALLHRFDVFDSLFKMIPQAREVTTLKELARLLWGMCV